jgi:hypothetical protein
VAEPQEEETPGKTPSAAAEPRNKKRKKGKKGHAGAEAAAGAASEGGAPPAAGDAPARAPGEAPQVIPPKHHARPAVGADLEGDVFLETAATSIDKLRENWQVIAAGLLFVVVVIAFVALKVESGKQRNREAWEGLRHVESLAKATPDDYLKGVDAFRGTAAEPFFLLHAADAYFKQGGKESDGKAIELYEQVARDFGANPVAARLAQEGLDAARAAGTFDAAKFAAGKPALETAKDK